MRDESEREKADLMTEFMGVKERREEGHAAEMEALIQVLSNSFLILHALSKIM